jgi:Nucleotidyl transferase of unknown function (DUF2204)
MPSSDGKLGPTLDRMEYGRALKGSLLMNEKDESWVPYAQPLLDAVSLFEELRVGYALIGGIAAMYYGRARFTEDVDFVAVAGHANIFTSHPEAMKKYHFDPTCTYKLYHQSGVQIDLWKDEHVEQIIQNAREVELAGRLIRIADPHDLIAMKLRARRLKDDYDISEIVRLTPIDETRLQSLVTPEQFAQFTEIKKRS